MDKNLRERLYNKTVETMDAKDLEYYNKLLWRKNHIEMFKQVVISGPLLGLTIGGLFSKLLFINVSLKDWLITTGMTTLLGTVCGLAYGGSALTSTYGLKELGLTKEEWKELVKSGRLKEISKMVEEYLKTDKSKLDALNLEQDNLESELRSVEESKQKLIAKMTQNSLQTNNEKVKQSDDTEKVIENQINTQDEEEFTFGN